MFVRFAQISSLLLLLSSSLCAIENSIIPVMQQFECIENLDAHKYPHKQFCKIASALGKTDERLRIASYNMLFNLYDHNLAPQNRWPERLPRIVELLHDMDADVIGIQELQPDQVQDLLPFVDDTYHFFSVDSSVGEQNGIFFKKERFSLIRGDVYPMEPTTATLTVVRLRDRRTQKTVAVCNAHFAFSNIENRSLQAHFVAKKVKGLVKHMPVIFMGDLNTFPNWPETGFPALDGDFVDKILSKKKLKDSYVKALAGHVGPISTFTNNPPGVEPFEGTGSPGVFLDHIYVSCGISVLLHAVQPATVDGHFPSDHMPVIIDCVAK